MVKRRIGFLRERSIASTVILLILLNPWDVLSQTESDKWILGEIFKDKPVDADIYCNVLETPFLYSPADNPIKKRYPSNRMENIVMTTSGLYFMLDGTERVYQIKQDPRSNEMAFIRQDSTSGFGYNHSAYVFSHQDTIFSLGGYGYWTYNWNLRYYNANFRRWELLPLNKRIYVTKRLKGGYIDTKQAQFFYSSNDSLKEEGLVHASPLSPVLTELFRLDLKKKQWSAAGKLTKEVLNLYEEGVKVCGTPYGELTILDSKGRFKALFLNCHTNQILELGDKDMSTRIYHKVRNPDMVGAIDRIIAYFHDDQLTILTSDRKKAKFTINQSDLVNTGRPVYIPTAKESVSTIPNTIILISVLEGTVILILGFLLFRQQTKNSRRTAPIEQTWMDQKETSLLKNIALANDLALTAEQIDHLLGTTSNSIDLKNKRRSIIIRSLNRKFQQATETDGLLIRSERMENDRRMVKYVLDLDNYRLIKEKLSR